MLHETHGCCFESAKLAATLLYSMVFEQIEYGERVCFRATIDSFVTDFYFYDAQSIEQFFKAFYERDMTDGRILRLFNGVHEYVENNMGNKYAA